jgi:hypothetical protein
MLRERSARTSHLMAPVLMCSVIASLAAAGRNEQLQPTAAERSLGAPLPVQSPPPGCTDSHDTRDR